MNNLSPSGRHRVPRRPRRRPPEGRRLQGRLHLRQQEDQARAGRDPQGQWQSGIKLGTNLCIPLLIVVLTANGKNPPGHPVLLRWVRQRAGDSVQGAWHPDRACALLLAVLDRRVRHLLHVRVG